jgi:hypothetical protein
MPSAELIAGAEFDAAMQGVSLAMQGRDALGLPRGRTLPKRIVLSQEGAGFYAHPFHHLALGPFCSATGLEHLELGREIDFYPPSPPAWSSSLISFRGHTAGLFRSPGLAGAYSSLTHVDLSVDVTTTVSVSESLGHLPSLHDLTLRNVTLCALRGASWKELLTRLRGLSLQECRWRPRHHLDEPVHRVGEELFHLATNLERLAVSIPSYSSGGLLDREELSHCLIRWFAAIPVGKCALKSITLLLPGTPLGFPLGSILSRSKDSLKRFGVLSVSGDAIPLSLIASGLTECAALEELGLSHRSIPAPDMLLSVVPTLKKLVIVPVPIASLDRIWPDDSIAWRSFPPFTEPLAESCLPHRTGPSSLEWVREVTMQGIEVVWRTFETMAPIRLVDDFVPPDRSYAADEAMALSSAVPTSTSPPVSMSSSSTSPPVSVPCALAEGLKHLCACGAVTQDLVDHLPLCPLTVVDCPLSFTGRCCWRGPRTALWATHLQRCEAYERAAKYRPSTVECPNGCGARIPEWDLRDHARVCWYARSPCLLASEGCTRCLRKVDMERHIAHECAHGFLATRWLRQLGYTGPDCVMRCQFPSLCVELLAEQERHHRRGDRALERLHNRGERGNSIASFPGTLVPEMIGVWARLGLLATAV